MKVSAERLEGSRVQLNVEIDPDRTEKSLDKAYRRLANRTHVPGFRKGKIPRPILERYLGRETLLQEALDDLVAGAYSEAITEHNVDAVARPEIEITQLEPVSFKATVPVRPDVELGDYQSIRFPLEKAEVKEEDVEAALKQIQEQAATYEPVERPVQFGDVVSADVRGTRDGEEILDQKEASFVVTEGATMPAPGFNEALIGMRKDEEKVIDLPFPADYENTELAGHNLQFKVTVHEVREKHLPPLDDELVRTVTDGVETLEQLRERIAANLAARAERENLAKLREDVLSAVSTAAKLEVPEALVDQEVERYIERQTEALRQQHLSLEQYLSFAKKSKEELQQELRPGALESIRREFILDKVAEVENIEVSEDEVSARIEVTALTSGQQAAAMRRLFSSPEARASLTESIRREKALDRLLDVATEGEISRMSAASSAGEPTAEAVQETSEEAAQPPASETAEPAEAKMVAEAEVSPPGESEA